MPAPPAADHLTYCLGLPPEGQVHDTNWYPYKLRCNTRATLKLENVYGPDKTNIPRIELEANKTVILIQAACCGALPIEFPLVKKKNWMKVGNAKWLLA